MFNLNKHKKVLIFGGTGFLGRELVTKMNKDGFQNIVIFSRDEGKLIEMQQEFPELEIITGDISDKFEVHHP